ncbi:MAG: hypothetical protein AAF757_04945 [Cyanobacteria bacterium P01_D01_bin.116]
MNGRLIVGVELQKMKNDVISFPQQKKHIARIIARNLSLTFASGCLGGLLNSLTVWIFGYIGITALFNVQIVPDLTASWLYPRIVWGGIWGFLFVLPFYQRKYIYKAILFSLIPSFVGSIPILHDQDFGCHCVSEACPIGHTK